ncbi:hypothetical protein THAOC_02672, partial [Thalassiosira oceanica]
MKSSPLLRHYVLRTACACVRNDNPLPGLPGGRGAKVEAKRRQRRSITPTPTRGYPIESGYPYPPETMPTRSQSNKANKKADAAAADVAEAESPIKEEEEPPTPAKNSADEKPPAPAAKDADDDVKEEEEEGEKSEKPAVSFRRIPRKRSQPPAEKDASASVEKPTISPAAKDAEEEKRELAKEGGEVIDDPVEPTDVPTSVPSGLIVKAYTGPAASGSGAADYYASRDAGTDKPSKAHILSLSLESLPKSSVGDGGKPPAPGILLGPAKAPWMELDRVGPHLLGEK